MVMTSDDFYDLLGINKSANEAEIKSAYKKTARKYHPDNSETGNEELFKKVQGAYDVLKDPQKKAIYDQYGAEGLKGAGGFSGARGFSDFGAGAAGFEDLGDIFSSFFGGGFGSAGQSRSRNAPRRGQDHRVDITLDFLEPIQAVKKKISINPLTDCSNCDGKGAEQASDIKTCTSCNGLGQVESVQNTILGQIRQAHTCPSCSGSGKTINNPCKKCKGKGQRREAKEVEITVPAGIHDGAQIRLAGLGDSGKNGGPTGDIYLVVNVRNHKIFQRDRENIFSKIEIGFAEAALGESIEIPTIRGKAELKIKAATQSNDLYTLKDEGMPRINNPSRNGDHYITVTVVTPEKLSGSEKKILEEFKKSRNGRDNKFS